MVLEKGPNFAVSPKEIPIKDIICGVEIALKGRRGEWGKSADYEQHNPQRAASRGKIERA